MAFTGRSDLRVIEVREAGGSETLWQLALDCDVLHLVTQQFVINVARYRGLVHCKCPQGALHPEATKYTIDCSKQCQHHSYF